MSEFNPELDSRIKYPCYKSFDEFFDVQRLRSLDGYIRERIEGRLSGHDDTRFYTGPFRLDAAAPDRPGSRMIYLSRSIKPDNYYDLNKAELWEATEEAGEFSLLMDFFAKTGRMLIMYADSGRAVSAHRDHVSHDLCHDFIWFRTNLDNPFYMLNPETGEKQYVESYSAWFDTVNQFHGADAREGLAFSIRVDGVFTDEFRERIPVPASNLASTPALWACTSG